ncbi:MAG: 30S ribosomal protein S12 methylthiotransferase RimO [Desulfobacterales bacterium]|nr:30S ribosomal protein S12 methylthiotransferase RimO [Desulfobacterales bacterium]
MKIYLVSLGCARNLVDSELILGSFKDQGWVIAKDPEKAHVIVINTCSFIKDAIDESLDTILELSKYKKEGICRCLIVVGCLPERFREQITSSLPEVDAFLGTGAFDKIIEVASNLSNHTCFLPNPNSSIIQGKNEKRVISSKEQAYIKIAEGCNRGCTYCVIPKLRGKHRSRPLEFILSEAKQLIDQGVKELTLVSQDTTLYGKEFGIDLSYLLTEMSKLSDDIWIRLLYLHPEGITDKLINTISSYPNICPYFDIPIQHSDKNVLKKMGRKYDEDFLYKLFDKIRNKVKDAVIRTTVLIGFPDEKKKNFDLLLNFIKNVRFDHLGAFIYSDAEDIPSYNIPGKVSKITAKRRLDVIMSEQASISLEINKKYIGKKLRVLVEEKQNKNLFTCRTIFQAPEVDGVTYVKGSLSEKKGFIYVKIKESDIYDLMGVFD